MHAGFAMLETGSCRAKNASNVLMKTLRGLGLWAKVGVMMQALALWWIGIASALFERKSENAS